MQREGETCDRLKHDGRRGKYAVGDNDGAGDVSDETWNARAVRTVHEKRDAESRTEQHRRTQDMRPSQEIDPLHGSAFP